MVIVLLASCSVRQKVRVTAAADIRTEKTETKKDTSHETSVMDTSTVVIEESYTEIPSVSKPDAMPVRRWTRKTTSRNGVTVTESLRNREETTSKAEVTKIKVDASKDMKVKAEYPYSNQIVYLFLALVLVLAVPLAITILIKKKQ